VSLNVLDVGAGPPMVLLHGFTGSARSWSYQTEAWASASRVIAPDLLGHGGSEAPSEPSRYALERQAADLVELLELLQAVPATVVGYSMGARLALTLTLLHPTVVRCLVLESPSAGIADGVARARRMVADDTLAADIERDGVAAFVDRWERLPLFATHARLPEDVRKRLHEERRRHQAGGLAGSLRGAGQGSMSPLHHRLAEIAVPTLVVAGALDETGVARSRVVAQGIPNATLRIVAEAGHTPHLERPASFVEVVDGFLATTSRTSSH
jgi:2-succinyl-6-hydroxy-2,4-cyclohexadiene-1-carboxylate synthase